MPQYLLPCTCGKKTPVSTAQAGGTIRCACGAELAVPTMRELGALDQADAPPGARPARHWENRHRGAFLLVLAALVCLGVAGYLWWSLPPLPVWPEPEEIAEAVEQASPSEALQIYKQIQQSGPLREDSWPETETRRMLTWGIGIAAGAAAILLVAALVVARGRRGIQAEATKKD